MVCKSRPLLLLGIKRKIVDWYKRWNALWDPDRYHGWGKKKNYFEGWYFKVVSPEEDYAFAFIPGISMPDQGEPHAFIQVLDGKKCTATYHRFAAEEFQPSDQKFALQLGANFFSADRLQIDLPELKGEFQFSGLTPWPKMLYAPGIMGWFSFVPFMECYHGVVSVNHTISGQLEIAGQAVDFTGGKGYMEKDWGRSFPNAWIWMQSNHFGEGEAVSLMSSVANIPWLGSHFVGYIVGFLLNGKIHRFATYTGAKMKAALGEDRVTVAFKDRKRELQIIAHKGEGGDLVSPISGEMTGKVNESMQAVLEVRFYENGNLVYSGEGRNAGLEVAGKKETLLTEVWRR